jgi:hypothetical protein
MGWAGAHSLSAGPIPPKVLPVRTGKVETTPSPGNLKDLSPARIRTLTERQLSALTEEQVSNLPEDQYTRLAHAQMHAWQSANNGVLPTFFHMSVVANPEYMELLHQPISIGEKGEKGRKEFIEDLAPAITGFSVDAPLGTMAGGLILEAKRHPYYYDEVSRPRYTRAHVAVNKPGAEVRVASDGTYVRIAFPDASPGKKGNIAFAKSDMHRIYDDLSKVSREEVDRGKLAAARVPWRDEPPTHTDAIKLQQGNIEQLVFSTSPGVKIDLKGVKGTKEKPIPINGMDNATFQIGKDTCHVDIEVTRSVGSHLTEPYQKQAIITVPVATAREMKATYKKDPNEFDGIEGLPLNPYALVHLHGQQQGIVIRVGGHYYVPDEDEERSGVRGSGISSTLRILNDEGTHYVDVPLTANGAYAHANPGRLAAAITAAAKALEPKAIAR